MGVMFDERPAVLAVDVARMDIDEVAVVVTNTVSGTSAETTVLSQPKRSASPTAMATAAANVKMMAARVRHERNTRKISVMRNMPKSGMTCFNAEPVFSSSHSLSHGDPTWRTAVKAPSAAANGCIAASMSASALSRLGR